MQFVMNEAEADLLKDHLEQVAMSVIGDALADAEGTEDEEYLQDEQDRIENIIDQLSDAEFTLTLDDQDKAIISDWVEMWIEAAEDGFENDEIEDTMIDAYNREMDLMVGIANRLEKLN